jgi:hypothetical protein
MDAYRSKYEDLFVYQDVNSCFEFDSSFNSVRNAFSTRIERLRGWTEFLTDIMAAKYHEKGRIEYVMGQGHTSEGDEGLVERGNDADDTQEQDKCSFRHHNGSTRITEYTLHGAHSFLLIHPCLC